MAYYNISVEELKGHAKELQSYGRKVDKTSTAQTLKHFVRDWTDSGILEREVTFPCILATLKDIIPDASAKVLLPGSGLNRLAHEVANLGRLLHCNPLYDTSANQNRL